MSVVREVAGHSCVTSGWAARSRLARGACRALESGGALGPGQALLAVRALRSRGPLCAQGKLASFAAEAEFEGDGGVGANDQSGRPLPRGARQEPHHEGAGFPGSSSLQARTPTTQHTQTVPTPSSSAPAASGHGQAVGTVYRLSSGQLVYVQKQRRAAQIGAHEAQRATGAERHMSATAAPTRTPEPTSQKEPMKMATATKTRTRTRTKAKADAKPKPIPGVEIRERPPSRGDLLPLPRAIHECRRAPRRGNLRHGPRKPWTSKRNCD